MAMIELIKLRTAIFTAEAELMFAGGVGNDVGQVAGDVFATFRRSQADFVKACDHDVRSAGDIEAVVDIQAGGGEIEVGVEVAEGLMEVVHAGE